MKSKIDYKEISKLIDLLEKRNLLDFELETEGFKIKISREHKLPEVKESTVTTEHLKSDQKNEKKETIEEKKDKSTDNNLHFITSPMVGTFYRAPDPSSPPFVEIGEDIKKNQTLCIIEAMKLMNEIESDYDGRVIEVMVENAQPVEFDHPLFTIEAA